MPWYWWLVIAYFGINAILTGIALFYACWNRELYWGIVWDMLRGLFLALPLFVISIINYWIDR